jgi:hypothetical protein
MSLNVGGNLGLVRFKLSKLRLEHLVLFVLIQKQVGRDVVLMNLPKKRGS